MLNLISTFTRQLSGKGSIVVIALLLLNGCSKDNLNTKNDLFDPGLKELRLHSGFSDNTLTVNAGSWSVDYVTDQTTGERLKNTKGALLILKDVGEVQLKAGWLRLAKTDENKLKINLRENFSDAPRDFVIGIQADGGLEEMHFIQSRAEGYEIVEKDVEEVEGSQKKYLSQEGCSTITLVNNTGQEKELSTAGVFQGVNYTSEFSSPDYGAFEWIGKEDSLVFMKALMVEGAIVWSDPVTYKAGVSHEDYIKANDKNTVTVRPYSSLVVSGKMQYVERTCKYTFTIKNTTSGHRFKISGIWKQKTPIVPYLYFH